MEVTVIIYRFYWLYSTKRVVIIITTTITINIQLFSYLHANIRAQKQVVK
jgi:hypothetical protein